MRLNMPMKSLRPMLCSSHSAFLSALRATPQKRKKVQDPKTKAAQKRKGSRLWNVEQNGIFKVIRKDLIQAYTEALYPSKKKKSSYLDTEAPRRKG